jgi:superfamily II DNA or RNA helicase/diadenosine tetraphosphate (Ap4A) HIT family hydrolase/SOS-response transcriptional repressor LexA
VSVFLEIPQRDWVASNDLAFAIRDRYPVSSGHTLIITRRVVADWFSATEDERLAIMRLVEQVKERLDAELHPSGYNVGFNAGAAAGQTVMHLHVHVIPRFTGDMDDPRGGVRHVIPSKGNYLRQVEPLARGGTTDPFSAHLFPLFWSARDIAIVAAFVQETGLDLIEPHVRAALARGARVRILTGDYLEITQASALESLRGWERTANVADDDAANPGGQLTARVVEVERLPGLTRAFHPKSWRFEGPGFGVAFVGSSNLSRSALVTGVEWNLRVDRDRDALAYARVREAFEELWALGRPLDAEWIAAYAARARALPQRLPVGEQEAEPLPAAPPPHAVQQEALDALRAARAKGRRHALVVMATGLGKTWLAAWDSLQLAEEMGGGSPPRVLFLAHRRELLAQAAKTFQRAFRDAGEHPRPSWCLGDESDLDGQLVFASVAKLSRQQGLAALAEQRFDYVVVDEVHHAAARSYRDILDVLERSGRGPPRFILGLTATPDRADTADILGLFNDYTAYSAGIDRGIELGRLVPFAYKGVKDDIEYDHIPWRNRRFDLEALATAAQTDARMETLWRAWTAYPGARTLIFCCTVAHATFVRDWLRDRKGARVKAVFAAPGSDARDAALAELAEGKLDAVCSVDMFNEGIDLPLIDRVVMLRPTESSVVFLQQLGRGLRAAEDKAHVTVIDFVGNHRLFVDRLRTLLSLGGTQSPDVERLLSGEGPVELPSGCSVELELEAKDQLSTIFGERRNSADQLRAVYRELRRERGERPTAGELQRLGYPPARLRREQPQRHESWFDFVDSEGDLAPPQRAAFLRHQRLLRELEQTEMTRSFKMITLQALLEARALRSGLALEALAVRAHELLHRSPELEADVAEAERVPRVDTAQRRRRWLAYWSRNPIEAWTAARSDGRTAWFRVEGEHFVPAFEIDPDHLGALEVLLGELIDLRLAEYRARQRQQDSSEDRFVCRVTWNQRDPILKLPTGPRERLPRGELDARVEGAVWQFRLQKEFCNVARPAGSAANQLPDLLRRWFGLAAGQPGTAFEVRFERSPDGWWVEPVRSNVIELTPRRGVTTYPDLRAAAGHASVDGDASTRSAVLLPVERPDPDVFAVRVSGNSMDGGKKPMHHGDWAVLRLARGAPAAAMEDRVVLVQLPAADRSQFVLKRLRRAGAGWQLTSDNPTGPTFDARADMVPIARLEEVITPESLAPPQWTVLAEQELGPAFGVEELQPRTGRWGGHLFLFVSVRGALATPERVRTPFEGRTAGETAFVLALVEGGAAYRYLGVGRWREDDACWEIPEVDFSTWRTWGEGRESSRALPAGALSRAEVLVEALVARPQEDRWIQRPDGRRARVLGRGARGGVRIDGGPGGFAERTVSTNDLAWVVVASDWATEHKAVLDEAIVNRCRYLAGTPKGSTRFIDTGWALGLFSAGKGLVDRAAGGGTGPRRVALEGGQLLDATYALEPLGDKVSLVFEARGGTSGTSSARNTQYAEGLGVLLERLGRHGAWIDDAQVESRDTLTLAPAARRMQLTYPLRLDDVDAARRALTASQARVGREPGARGPGARGPGNRTRRIRLVLGGVSVLPEVAKLLGPTP